MSSIDKYVEETAQSIDSRVHVRHEGDQLVGTIHGQEVFRMADRYGYLNDTEERFVRQQVNRYLANEQAEIQRRREEEERRRREEEERRRREEEARQRAIRDGKSQLEARKREVSAHFDNIAKANISSFNVDSRVQEAFDISAIVGNAQKELDRVQSKMASDVEKQKQSALSLIDATIRGLDNSANAQEAINTVNRVKSTRYQFDTSPYMSDIKEIQQKLGTALKACEKSLGELLEFDRKYHSPTSQSILNMVKRIHITTVKDLEQVRTLIQDAIGTIEDERERARLEESLNTLKEANKDLVDFNLLCNVDIGSIYEIPQFENEIEETKQKIMAMRQNLMQAEYSTVNAELLENVDNYLSQIQLGEVGFNTGSSLLDELQKVKMKDERLLPAFESFKRARDYAISSGISVDFDFDPNNPESQLDEISSLIAANEIENEQGMTWQRGMATHALMDGLGYELLSFKDQQGILSYIYARQDLKGVVMQVNVTSEGVRRKLVAVRQGNVESSVEEVKAAARILEQQEEPVQFMEGYTTLYEGAEIAADCGFSDTEGVDEIIAANGAFDLDEEGKLSEYKSIMKEDNIEFIITTKIEKGDSQKRSINAVLEQDRSEYYAARSSQVKARYQYKQ